MPERHWTGATDGDLGTATNYAEGYTPVDGDDVIFENNAVDVDAGLTDLMGVALGSLWIAKSFTGAFGTSTHYAVLGAHEVHIGHNFGGSSPAGSGRIKLHLENVGSAQTEVTIYDTPSSPTDANREPVQLLCDDPEAVINVRKGRVAIGPDADDAPSLHELRVGFSTNRSADAQVYVGPGVSLTNVKQWGGSLLLRCGAQEIIQREGTLTTEGIGAIASWLVEAGLAIPNALGAISALDVFGGVADFLRSPEVRNVTNLRRRAAGTVKWNSDVLQIDSLDTGGDAALGAA